MFLFITRTGRRGGSTPIRNNPLKKRIFICYRTVDEPDDFEEKIFEAIRAASVLLVVIGPNRLGAGGEHGRGGTPPNGMV